MSEVIQDDSFSRCEACGERWVSKNHAALAGRHRASTGHATETHTHKTTRHGAAPELPGQLSLIERREAA